mmetsp:Transcript_19420/g.59818  ORF Transcript_19420/g.59818 Transcript_19420/m.59818 type:complete len:194 (+) Transcript_19420:275-856(+)
MRRLLALLCGACGASALVTPQRRRARLAALRSEPKKDVIDELLPRFRRGAAEPVVAAEPDDAGPAAEVGTINDKLLAEIEAAKSQYRIEAPQEEERELVDVSDVNPVQSVLSGFAALAAAYVFWLGVSFAAESFAEHPVTSEFYPIQRISTIMRTVVLGLGTLLTGLTAFAGVGLLALGGKVGLGLGGDEAGE